MAGKLHQLGERGGRADRREKWRHGKQEAGKGIAGRAERAYNRMRGIGVYVGREFTPAEVEVGVGIGLGMLVGKLHQLGGGDGGEGRRVRGSKQMRSQIRRR